ncbi:MAG: bifunctional glutamate N-acetyltransferase/amino-acid acetyltransferase ArgJ [Actinobacteria bacterium]|nr:bifunctional glutamate N-acetyltransferase/amino-acid acetyltransferase ArgJ [Actinomycetota bacterium]
MLTRVDGGVCAAPGFRASGIIAGLRASGRSDLALVAADGPCTAAATIATNRVLAAPCVVTKRNVADGSARAVVINSGNANACTGPDGLSDAEATTEVVARELGTAPTDVLVCSTGIIGVRVPIERLLSAIPTAVAALSPDGNRRAAEAITTTDTTIKEVAVQVRDDSGSCTIGGMAKGAGMIEPAMATMLAVITTDAPLTPAVLRPMVRQAVDRTFNRISIDACGSTNDTVAVLANGRAPTPPSLSAFRTGLEAVCADLARAIVADGEGVSRTAQVRVTGAHDERGAVTLARAIAASTLFRAALRGADPNWGRVLAAMGSTDVEFDPGRVAVSFGGITVCRFGVATAFDRGQAAAAMSKDEVKVTIDLHVGQAEATFLTAELTPEYVRFNSEYTT